MWGLYENLPPPSTTTDPSAATNLTKSDGTSSQSQKDEWSVEAKLLAPALRRKTAAAAAHVNVKKSSRSNVQYKRELAQSLESDHSSVLEQPQFQTAISALWSGVQDAYDPLNPNDYEKVLEDRKKQRTQDPPSKLSAAFAPPQIYHQEDGVDQLATPNIPQVPSLKSTTTSHTNVAAKMMAKMGYKEGHGLGKTEQGITTPLMAKKADNRTAVIVHPEIIPSTNITPESKVLLLLNVVGPGEVDEYLKPEIQEECTKYGLVDSCKIYEHTEKTIPPEQAVRIFVCFDKIEGAQKAYESLHGRYFGGRVVQAFFFGEDQFRQNDLKFRG